MKKLTFLALVCGLMLFSVKSKADDYSDGFRDGQALGTYVVTTYVLPNMPTIDQMFVIGNEYHTETTPDGLVTYTYTDIEPGQATVAMYNALITNYAYDFGILAFYRDFIDTDMHSLGIYSEYYISGYRAGYMSRMHGRVLNPN